MDEVFISYSRDDTPFVDKLCQHLEKIGVPFWIDRRNIVAGEDWANAINRGLKACGLMILVISTTSVNSSQVELEWKYFFYKKKRIIPIRLHRAVEPHYQINALHYIDMAGGDYRTAFDELTYMIKTGTPSLNGDPAEKTPIPSAPPPKPLVTGQLNPKVVENFERENTIRFGSDPILTISVLGYPQAIFEIMLEDRKNYVIGRKDVGFQPEIDLSQFDAHKNGVSRRHMYLERYDMDVYVTGLPTTNPTLVNGRPLYERERYRIRNGDKLTLGRLTLQLHFFK